MDAPIESLPPVARERLETIGKRIHEEPRDYTLLEKFWLGLPSTFGFWMLEKGMEEAEEFVIDFFRRDQEWIDNASRILAEEAEKTARAAAEAQLKSAFGKSLPDDFAFSQNQLAAMRIRARAGLKMSW